MVKTHIYCTIESVVVLFFAKSTEILDYSKFRIILHRENNVISITDQGIDELWFLTSLSVIS
jgi:hypothetical protein